jgi:hypothetical protein
MTAVALESPIWLIYRYSSSETRADKVVDAMIGAIVCMRRGPYHQRGNAPRSAKIDDEATRMSGLGIKPDEGFDHAVFLGFHHMERFFEVIKGKGMGRQWRRVDATRLQKPQ